MLSISSTTTMSFHTSLFLMTSSGEGQISTSTLCTCLSIIGLQTLIAEKQRHPHYGFKTADNVKDHADCLKALSQHIPVWPPVDEILAASRKADVINVFDRIANEVTHTVRPKTTLLNLPLKSVPRDVVLKREGSDTGSHVLLPQRLQRTTLKALNNQLKGRFRWFAQTWIPELRQFGEWRVFIVDGKIIEIVTTQPLGKGHEYDDRLAIGVLHGSWSLEELTSVESTSLLLILSLIVQPQKALQKQPTIVE